MVRGQVSQENPVASTSPSEKWSPDNTVVNRRGSPVCRHTWAWSMEEWDDGWTYTVRVKGNDNHAQDCLQYPWPHRSSCPPPSPAPVFPLSTPTAMSFFFMVNDFYNLLEWGFCPHKYIDTVSRFIILPNTNVPFLSFLTCQHLNEWAPGSYLKHPLYLPQSTWF